MSLTMSLSMSRTSSWLTRTLAPRFRPIAVSCAVAAFIVGTVAGQQRGAWFWVLLAVAATLTAAAVGLPMWAEKVAKSRAVDAENSAEAAKQQMRLVVGRVLTPLSYLLGEITDARPRSPELERLQGQALTLVLAAATELVEPAGARACFFAIRRGSEAGRPRKLTMSMYYGRAEPAMAEISEDSPLGAEAFGLIARDEEGFFPDLRAGAPAGWRSRPHRHRGLVAVPVVTSRESFGLLIVDTLEPGVLTESDVEVVRLLGDLLAAALNH